MNVHHDYRDIELHIRRARKVRSAVLGHLIGNAMADAWLGLTKGSRWVAKKAMDLAHALPAAPTH